MEIINIWWEGSFAPNSLELRGLLRKPMDGLENEFNIYLVYNLIGVEWELLYVGTTNNSFYNRDIEKWDVGSGQTFDTIMIYEGTLYDVGNISVKEKEKKLKKAEALLINVLEESYRPPCIANISKNMFVLNNLNIEERLYPLLKAKYYWEDELIYDFIAKMGKHLSKEPIFIGSFYGFCINDIYFGVDSERGNEENRYPIIRLNIIDITWNKKEKIENELSTGFNSNGNYYFIPLGGLSRENLDIIIQGAELILSKISRILNI